VPQHAAGTARHHRPRRGDHTQQPLREAAQRGSQEDRQPRSCASKWHWALAGIDDRRTAQPWYRTKTEPAFEDMLIKLRRVLIAARISGSRPAQPTDDQIRAVLAAWDAAVA
jgi:hypothetical protein